MIRSLREAEAHELVTRSYANMRKLQRRNAQKRTYDPLSLVTLAAHITNGEPLNALIKSIADKKLRASIRETILQSPISNPHKKTVNAQDTAATARSFVSGSCSWLKGPQLLCKDPEVTVDENNALIKVSVTGEWHNEVNDGNKNSLPKRFIPFIESFSERTCHVDSSFSDAHDDTLSITILGYKNSNFAAAALTENTQN